MPPLAAAAGESAQTKTRPNPAAFKICNSLTRLKDSTTGSRGQGSLQARSGAVCLPAQGNVTVAIEQPGATIGSLTTTAVTSAPGIFSLDGTGTGQDSIFNQDGTLNTPDNPAAKGSIVTIYAKGLGPLTPTPLVLMPMLLQTTEPRLQWVKCLPSVLS